VILTTALAAAFWLGVLGTLYAYVGLPVLSVLLARSRRKSTGGPGPAPGTPGVTVIIPAYNEEASIGAKLRNTLEADYPRHLLDVTVVSDGSTDRTDAIARSFETEGIQLIVQEQRTGKTAGLNRAVASARGEILVFTDANAAYSPDTIRRLTEPFGNAQVGLVTGYTRYRLTGTGDVAEVTNVYTSLERLIKRAESRWGCCAGADGAIFAMRRSLYRTLRDDDINDFVLPLQVIEQGYHGVFEEDAYCSENPGASLETEFRRQSRIANRTLRALWRHVHLLNPFRFPAFAFFLFSHKVARFLVPIFLILSGLSALLLAVVSGGLYIPAAIGFLLGAALTAHAGATLESLAGRFGLARSVHFVHAFLRMNLALLDGWRKFVTGRREITWQPDRSAKAAEGA
jgi:cellulose synthase/poly-beta-1,6-N-acetylglucosamine synthase-like glycosyltransferase